MTSDRMHEPKLHVVLGAGPLGLAVARHLAARGDRVRAAVRGGRADLPEGVEVVGADLNVEADTRRACEGAAVVYHCANPPYARWADLHPPLMDAVIEGAAAAGARLVFGDNLYAYGAVHGPLTEDLPYLARGPNGRTRAQIAETLLRAHGSGRIRATIGRASDFFGPYVHLSSVGDRVFAQAIKGKAAQVLGDPDVPHTVTYIEDFGRALVTLGEHDEALGEVWHVPNAETVTMRRFVQLAFESAGQTFPPSRGAAVGHHDGRPVQSDDACGQGAALSVRAALGGRQHQVRASIRLDRYAVTRCGRGNGRLVPGPDGRLTVGVRSPFLPPGRSMRPT